MEPKEENLASPPPKGQEEPLAMQIQRAEEELERLQAELNATDDGKEDESGQEGSSDRHAGEAAMQEEIADSGEGEGDRKAEEEEEEEGDGLSMAMHPVGGRAETLVVLADAEVRLWRLKQRLSSQYPLRDTKVLLVMACIHYQEAQSLQGRSMELLIQWGSAMSLLAKKYFIPPLYDQAAEKYGQAVQLAPNRVLPLRKWAISLSHCAESRARVDGEYCASLFQLAEEKFMDADQICRSTVSYLSRQGQPAERAEGSEEGEIGSGCTGPAPALSVSAESVVGGDGAYELGTFPSASGTVETVTRTTRNGGTMTVIKSSALRRDAVDTSEDFREQMLELAVDWGVATRRHALVHESQGELHKAMRLMNAACQKFCNVLRLEPTCARGLHQWAKTIDCMGMLRVVDPKVDLTQAVELFLTMFTTLSSIHGPSLSLKPMIALCFSRNKAVQEANPVSVLRYLALHGQGHVQQEAKQNLVFIEEYLKEVKAEYDEQSTIEQTVSRVVKIEDPELAFAHMPTSARKIFEKSGVGYEDVRDHKDLVTTLLLFLTDPRDWAKALLRVHKYPNLLPQTALPEIEFCEKDPKKDFRHRTKIGEGAFSSVFTAHKKGDGHVALKVYNKSLTEAEKTIRKEVGLLQLCDHPNVVHATGAYLWNDRVWAVMEYCNGGSLRQMLNQVSLSERQVAYVAKEILTGLAYLHQKKKMVHRDLKASNILLFLDGRVQIGDLGLCEEIRGGDIHPLPIAGSRCWMAPEVLFNRPYGFKADVWSFGCILHEMADKRPPYHEKSALKGMVLMATKGNPGLKEPKKWSSAFRDFVTQCFHKNPRTRASVSSLLEHPFLDSACEAGDMVECLRVAFIANTLMNTGIL